MATDVHCIGSGLVISSCPHYLSPAGCLMGVPSESSSGGSRMAQAERQSIQPKLELCRALVVVRGSSLIVRTSVRRVWGRAFRVQSSVLGAPGAGISARQRTRLAFLHPVGGSHRPAGAN